MAVASAGPYANVHQTDNHASIPPLSFLQAGCPSCCPANSTEALQADTTHTTQPFYCWSGICPGRHKSYIYISVHNYIVSAKCKVMNEFEGCESSRTHVKSYLAISYPSQLVPILKSSYAQYQLIPMSSHTQGLGLGSWV